MDQQRPKYEPAKYPIGNGADEKCRQRYCYYADLSESSAALLFCIFCVRWSNEFQRNPSILLIQFKSSRYG